MHFLRKKRRRSQYFIAGAKGVSICDLCVTRASEVLEDILAAKKDNPSADVSALEEKIDNLVFDLYGLTPEEREIIKGNVK